MKLQLPVQLLSALRALYRQMNRSVSLPLLVVTTMTSGSFASDLIWNGTSWSTDTASTDWLNGEDSAAYADGDNVTFNGGGNSSVTITGTVTPGSIVVDSDTDYTLTGTISGSTTLVKKGAGTLTLSGASSNFTGDLTIQEGTVKLGSHGGNTNGGALGAGNYDNGSISRTISVASGATLNIAGYYDNRYAVTIAGDGVDGNGAFVNNGSTIGNTKVNFCQLTLSDDASIGGTGNFCIIGPGYNTSVVDLAGYTLTKKGSNSVELRNTSFREGTLVVDQGTISITSSNGKSSDLATVNLKTSGTGIFSLGQNVTVKTLNGAEGTVSLNASTLTVSGGGSYAGVISGTGGVTVSGGNLVLTGANTATGALTVSSGATVQLGDGTTATTAWAGTLAGEGTAIVNVPGTLTLQSDSSIGTLTMTKGILALSSTTTGTGTLSVGTLSDIATEDASFYINLGSNSQSDKITVTNNYTGSKLNFIVNGTEAGTYTIFSGVADSYSTDKINVEPLLQRGLKVETTVESGSIKLTISGTATSAANLIWAGSDGQHWSTNEEVKAWTNNSVSDYFASNDTVTFNGGGISDVTLSGIVNPGSITVEGTKDYTIQHGYLQGTGTLTKSGSCTFTIKSSTDISGWTAPLVINDGTVAFDAEDSDQVVLNTTSVTGSGTLSKTGAGTLTIANSSALTGFAGTINSSAGTLQITVGSDQTIDQSTLVLSGAGTIEKIGSGTLMINHQSTLSGNLVISQGQVTLGLVSGNSSAGSNINWGENGSTVTLGNGTTFLIGGSSSSHHTVGADLILGQSSSDSVTLQYFDGSKASLTESQYNFTGTVTVNGNALITNPKTWAKSVQLSGTLTGSGTLTFRRPYGDGYFNTNGYLWLTANAENYEGSILIDAATTTVSQGLRLGTDLAQASVTLQSHASTALAFAYLQVEEDVTIKTLNGNARSHVGAIGGARTLTLGSGTYAGTITDNGVQVSVTGSTNTIPYDTTGVLSLVKTGADSLTLSGTVSYTGTTTVEDGTLILSGDISGMTGAMTLKKGTINLSGNAASMAISIQSGTLTGASGYTGTKSVTIDTTDASDPASVTLSGVKSSAIKSVTLSEGAMLTYTNGDSVLDLTDATVTLKMTTTNVTEQSSDGTAMITAEAVKLTASKTTLDLSNSELVNLLTGIKEGDTKAYLHVTNNALTFTDSYKSQLLAKSDIISQLGFSISGVEGGSVVLNGDAVDVSDIYIVTDVNGESYPETIDSYRSLDPYKAVIIDDNKTLAVTLDGAPSGDTTATALQVRNLVGADNSSLTVTNSDTSATAVVLLDNKSIQSETEDVTQENLGTNTLMEGSINGGTAVTFVKQGEGTLTVKGAVNADTVQVEEGGLTLNGSSKISSLVLDGTTSAAKVSIGGATTTTLTEVDSLDNSSANGGAVTVASAGKLSLTGKSQLTKSTLSGSGTVTVANGATLELSDTASISGVNLTVDGTADLKSASTDRYQVSTLNGSGEVALSGGTLTVNGSGTSAFSGTISGDGTLDVENGTVTLANAGNDDLVLNVKQATVTVDATKTATQALRATRAASSGSISYEGINLQQGAELIVGSSSSLDQKLEVGSQGITLASGSTLTFNLSAGTETELKSMAPLATSTGAITLNSGSTVKLLDDNTLVSADEENLSVVLMKGGSAATVGSVTLQAAFLSTVYDDLALSKDGNNVVLTGTVREDNIFETTDMTPNATAGSELLWKSRFNLRSGDSVLKSAYLSISDMLDKGNTAGAQKAMAAVAGSTVNALGTAQHDALRNQMGWVRNRTVTMGVDQSVHHEDMPYYHMWVEGTGSVAQLNSDGDEGGYKLNTWGGTVGFDVDLTEHITVGAALSALYGDLSSSAAESADGSLDSYYVSLFGRYQKSAWAHTLILTGSFTDATLDRTVNYGTGSYTTQGDTDGSGFGAMYELTYDIALNEDKTSIIQPLFNASIVNTTMKSYTETGAGNAGLEVGKQDWTTATLALGARWMGLVGTNVFGREALLEVRANIAQDFGDDQGETKVGLLARPDFTQTVYGAKVGKTAVQFGVGLSLPVGQQGTVFVNGNADVRSGAHSFNGSLGYRYSF